MKTRGLKHPTRRAATKVLITKAKEQDRLDLLGMTTDAVFDGHPEEEKTP
jgi:hypothetical protein